MIEGIILGIGLHAKVKVKQKRINKKRPILELEGGHDLFKKDNKWNYLTRIIDRENDHYLEVIKDIKTEKIIKKEDCKLSDHYGHGSAKWKKNRYKILRFFKTIISFFKRLFV
ncbi:MAG: zinc ribbon domain-containing protein [Candidatus Methanofastidiosum sp.]|nr:zinc ribbon domain-containing protein [Methanofastidiosum sp.]